MHDLLLAKRGIAAPATHPLRLAVTKHKARLNAELTKARLKRGFASIEGLRNDIEIGGINGCEDRAAKSLLKEKQISGDDTRAQSHPRWVRVNTLRTSLDEQLATTFSGYRAVDSVEQLVLAANGKSNVENILHVDKHIPNLLAIPQTADVSNTFACRNGLIILQDKASCFPAYLLDPEPEHGPSLDACAAPGNKTTHLAALLQSRCAITGNSKVWACERDKERAMILQKMIIRAGAKNLVEVKAPQDFLRLDPYKAPWDSVSSLLLDPSCSGSGMIGREDMPNIVLPSKQAGTLEKASSKKRKRKATTELEPDHIDLKEEVPIAMDDADVLRKRLEALSAFQLKLILRAFQFPSARKITYSTCSIHAEENEYVVIRALTSSIAKKGGWHILPRAAQVSGMKAWRIRGDLKACQEMLLKDDTEDVDVNEVAEGCIRCEKGTTEGTQGFFVAAFTRDSEDLLTSGELCPGKHQRGHEFGDEWEGFED